MTRKNFIKRFGLVAGFLASAPIVFANIKPSNPYISPLDFMSKRDIRRRVRVNYKQELLFDFLYAKGKRSESDFEFTWYEDDG